MVHNVASVLIYGSIPCLWCVQMLETRLTQPVGKSIRSKDVLYFLGHLRLYTVTDELAHSTTLMDLVLENINKVQVCLHFIDASNQILGPNKELCTHATIINRSYVRVVATCVATSSLRLWIFAVRNCDLKCWCMLLGCITWWQNWVIFKKVALMILVGAHPKFAWSAS